MIAVDQEAREQNKKMILEYMRFEDMFRQALSTAIRYYNNGGRGYARVDYRVPSRARRRIDLMMSRTGLNGLLQSAATKAIEQAGFRWASAETHSGAFTNVWKSWSITVALHEVNPLP